MKIITKKAFSLIELSIVILIIGILIAGAAQGINLYTKFKLSTARALTSSSPVSGIKDLVVWWDSVSEQSFDSSETYDGLQITNWYDLNPQTTAKNNARQASSSLRPYYKDKCINQLPCVNFNTSGTVMTTLQDLGLTTPTKLNF